MIQITDLYTSGEGQNPARVVLSRKYYAPGPETQVKLDRLTELLFGGIKCNIGAML